MGHVASFESGRRYGPDCGCLAIRLNKRAIFVETCIKNTVGTIRRIEAIAPCSAKERGLLPRLSSRERVAPIDSSVRRGSLVSRSPGGSGCSPGKSVTPLPVRHMLRRPNHCFRLSLTEGIEWSFPVSLSLPLAKKTDCIHGSCPLSASRTSLRPSRVFPSSN